MGKTNACLVGAGPKNESGGIFQKALSIYGDRELAVAVARLTVCGLVHGR